MKKIGIGLLITCLLIFGLVIGTMGCIGNGEEVIVDNEVEEIIVDDDVVDDEVEEIIVDDDEKKIIVEYSSYTTDIIGDGEFFADEAKSGSTFLILDMTISNNGYDEFSTNSFYWKVLVNNIEYGTAFVIHLEDELRLVTLRDGGKISGNLAFEVPEDVTDFEMIYDAFRNYNIEYIQN